MKLKKVTPSTFNTSLIGHHFLLVAKPMARGAKHSPSSLKDNPDPAFHPYLPVPTLSAF
jgi:hypothetical protein